MLPNQPTQQSQEQQQQQGIFGSHPGLTHDHGSEIRPWDNRRPLELEDLLPPAAGFFPGSHDGSVER